MNGPPKELSLLFDLSSASLRRRSDRVFFGVLSISIVSFCFAARWLSTIPWPSGIPARISEKIKVDFLVQEKRQPPKKKSLPPKQKPIDLTKQAKPVIQQAGSVRKIYGVRRVFSVGLGTGEGGSQSIVSKLGNTLDQDPDSLTATERDLKGKLVSVTAITKMPQVKVAAKPVYTEAMRKNKVEGTISAELLIDVDGAVREVRVLNDLGYGTKESTEAACKKLIFTPAMQGDLPVAVRITMKFKFVLQT